MRTRNLKEGKKAGKAGLFDAVFVLLCFLLVVFTPVPVFAAGNTGAITTSFKSIYNIIAAIVTSIGQLGPLPLTPRTVPPSPWPLRGSLQA